jgi:hypothetical protein
MRSSGWFIAFAVACVAGAAVYVALAAGDDGSRAAVLPRQQAVRTDAASTPLDPSLRLAVRAVDAKNPRAPGVVSVVEPADPSARRDRHLRCERVYEAGGHGLCLSIDASGVEYRVQFLDAAMRPRSSIALTGVPSRARVSGDGRYGSVTTFTAGDSYTAPGQFSTRTWLLDMSGGRMIADLERFTVVKDGRVIDAPDFNFWGVTFSHRDSDRFWATLGTGSHHYLVQGSVRSRRVQVIADAVECPSVSPDDRRIAFKQPLGHGRWRLSVLELATMRRHVLAETRSIDDQQEWVDDAHVAYSDGEDVWAVQSDGGGRPQLLVQGAQSPVALSG